MKSTNKNQDNYQLTMSLEESKTGQFLLMWYDYHTSLASGLKDMFQEESMKDVTLACEGQYIQAHKLVLSMGSPYFRTLFKVNPCKHPIVILKDMRYKDLEAIVQFMYEGEVSIKGEDMMSFLKAADVLEIKALTGENSDENATEEVSESNKTGEAVAQASTEMISEETSDWDMVIPCKKIRRETQDVIKTHDVLDETKNTNILKNEPSELQQKDSYTASPKCSLDTSDSATKSTSIKSHCVEGQPSSKLPNKPPVLRQIQSQIVRLEESSDGLTVPDITKSPLLSVLSDYDVDIFNDLNDQLFDSYDSLNNISSQIESRAVASPETTLPKSKLSAHTEKVAAFSGQKSNISNPAIGQIPPLQLGNQKINPSHPIIISPAAPQQLVAFTKQNSNLANPVIIRSTANQNCNSLGSSADVPVITRISRVRSNKSIPVITRVSTSKSKMAIPLITCISKRKSASSTAIKISVTDSLSSLSNPTSQPSSRTNKQST